MVGNNYSCRDFCRRFFCCTRPAKDLLDEEAFSVTLVILLHLHDCIVNFKCIYLVLIRHLRLWTISHVVNNSRCCRFDVNNGFMARKF